MWGTRAGRSSTGPPVLASGSSGPPGPPLPQGSSTVSLSLLGPAAAEQAAPGFLGAAMC